MTSKKRGGHVEFNGIMIDCSRLMERHEFYFELLDFMADWGMNTLVLHFSDDHGLAIGLEGFETLAMDRAFAADEVRAVVAHAADRGIEVIPELETFGHTRFITDHPEHEHLFAGRKTSELLFNAVDPRLPETHDLMQRLLSATAELFPSRYLHVGCDEVDLTDYCRERDLDVSQTWSDYVNRVIGMVRGVGKTPMMWADHVANSPAITENLRRDVVLVDWRYYTGVADDDIARLAGLGFEGVIGSPSLACALYRFLPTESAHTNTLEMIRLAAAHGYGGIVNTIWCPYRYFQKSIYYGIALSATAVASAAASDTTAGAEVGGTVSLNEFRRSFASRVFGTSLTPPLETFLTEMPAVDVTDDLVSVVTDHDATPSAEQAAHFTRINAAGEAALEAAAAYEPVRNRDIYAAMVLGVQAGWLCSESVMLRGVTSAKKRKERYNSLLAEVRGAAGADWDATRFPESPQKSAPLFPGQEGQYALLILELLPTL